ncbi:hypothetical protein [Mariniblastus fucicola]|uniref:Uncharacterized protein n=1 Tax=Mariniblastus fucicola TaxID=980251 RepID=A0A5B9PII2_9BACT|nr:hypothetical protein [Mariniblastus fucicola]QEG24496.1 hypothetical protein MFFC18_44160 [Mariniblastus fucicola]
MAARENQGYVIGIIVLAVLAVMLLVTTVFSTMKAYENFDRMNVAVEDATFQKARATALDAKANMLAACIGVEGKAASEITTYRDLASNAKRDVSGNQSSDIQKIADSAQAIYEVYTKDMAFNSAITDEGEDVADVDMTYRGTVDKMASALRSSNDNASDKSREADRIRDEAEQKIATVTNTLNERTKALAQTEQDLTDEKARNKAEEQALFNQAKSIQDAMDTQGAEFEDQKDGLEKEIADTKENLEFVVKQNESLKTKVNEYEREVFDMADGQIVQVSESSGNVFIDMGRLDGIRANLTFAVYDRTANDFEKDRHKAMIEVTEVLGPHLSKARVTTEDPLNPILSKDQVLSATFDRGDAVTIALGGFFDLDGDGLSDLEKLKRMIVRNGGRVVASHDENGNITGEIDSTTRYFVLGPSPRTGVREVVAAMKTMQEQAEGNSVDTIDIRKLRNWMGIHGNATIERMDNRIGEDTGFAPRSPSGQ